MEITLAENILNVYFRGKLLTFFPYFLTSAIPFPPLWLRVKIQEWITFRELRRQDFACGQGKKKIKKGNFSCFEAGL